MLSLLLITAFSGCSNNSTKTASTDAVDKAALSADTKQTSPPEQYIDKDNVVSVTRTGGLPRFKVKVLFSGHDDDKIKKIVDMVNRGTGKRTSDKEEVDSLRFGYPAPLTFLMKDNRLVKVWSFMKITRTQNGASGTGYKDRFILSIENGSSSEYYTLYSSEIPEYMTKVSQEDMPCVTELNVSPDKVSLGQNIALSGDGSAEKELNIYLTDGTGSDTARYLIAKVATSYGQWKWNGMIEKPFKDLSGKAIELTKNRCFFEIESPSSQSRMSAGELDISK